MTADPRLPKFAIFYVSILLFFSVGAITTGGLNWYAALTVPAWAPSNVLTAVVWLVLFLCAAFSMMRFWDRRETTPHGHLITLAYLGNAGLVLLWNFLFFGAHRLGLSLIAAVAVTISLIALMLLVRRASHHAFWLLTPYLLWMLFAIALSHRLFLLN